MRCTLEDLLFPNSSKPIIIESRSPLHKSLFHLYSLVSNISLHSVPPHTLTERQLRQEITDLKGKLGTALNEIRKNNQAMIQLQHQNQNLNLDMIELKEKDTKNKSKDIEEELRQEREWMVESVKSVKSPIRDKSVSPNRVKSDTGFSLNQGKERKERTSRSRAVKDGPYQ